MPSGAVPACCAVVLSWLVVLACCFVSCRLGRLGRGGLGPRLASQLLEAAAHGRRVALDARHLRPRSGAAALFLVLLDIARGQDGHVRAPCWLCRRDLVRASSTSARVLGQSRQRNQTLSGMPPLGRKVTRLTGSG